MSPLESHGETKVAHKTLETDSTDCKVSKHSQLSLPVLHMLHTARTQAVHPPVAGRLPRKDRCHWCGVKEVCVGGYADSPPPPLSLSGSQSVCLFV